MNLQFNIHYHTLWGERLCVCLQYDEQEPTICDLGTTDGHLWSLNLDAASLPALPTCYHYVLKRDTRVLRSEPSGCHTLLAHIDTLINDEWLDTPYPHTFGLSFFTACTAPTATTPLSTQPESSHICIAAPPPGQKSQWAICTSLHDNWQRPLRACHTAPFEWVVSIDAGTPAFDFKIVRIDADGRILQWEEGANRTFIPQDSAASLLHLCPRLPAPLLWHGAGVVIPVFSLRSEHSWGIGDLGDLGRMVDWTSACGMTAIQILPINDTTTTGSWRDSYPYSPISVHALHPIYADLGQTDIATTQAYEALRIELNRLPALDYERVFLLKELVLRELYDAQKGQLHQQKDYADFCRDNAGWLRPYAAFRFLSRRYGTADFRTWPAYSSFKAQAIDDLLRHDNEARSETDFHIFVQYLLHQQLSRVKRHAAQKGVAIKGDLPIGVSRNSVESWTAPHLFCCDSQAGAPPDAFAQEGQNWGFPTYHWKAMRHDNYAWWRERLTHMSRYFDAYRIDHVLGFFRIWEIPIEQTNGLMGHFQPALPLSPDEIAARGFLFSSETHARSTLFADDVAAHPEWLPYIETDIEGNYHLKAAFSTQRLVSHNAPPAMVPTLQTLVAEVLFVEDPHRPGFFHPRIDAQHTRQYAHLDEGQQEAFDRLYDDFFYHRHNAFWAKEAYGKLQTLTRCTGMLACAEDLGMVPASVKGVLEQLEILSLEIQRMPKQPGRELGDLAQNPYLSVSTIATHDMPPLRLWWKQARHQATLLWNNQLGQPGSAPDELSSHTARAIIAAHLASPSMLCLLALQDWLAMAPELNPIAPEQEQINQPADAHHYWRYRMPICIEKLAANETFTAKIRQLIANSCR